MDIHVGSTLSSFCAVTYDSYRTDMDSDELRRVLDELDLNRREAADALGVSPSTVRHWLSGRHRIPTPAAKLLRLWARRQDLRPSAVDDVPAEELVR